jgi:SpoVK/Ycf46/Vps4 family AAA+-type ATPase
VTSEIKEEMQKLIKQYKNKDLFEAIGINLPRGILLYGPPGTGKTLLAKALAHEIGVIFYSFQPKDIFSSWMNESIEKIDEIFSSLETPCIIFIDEIEVILKKRSDHSHGNNEDAKIVNAFLQIMDGFETKRDILFI